MEMRKREKRLKERKEAEELWVVEPPERVPGRDDVVVPMFDPLAVFDPLEDAVTVFDPAVPEVELEATVLLLVEEAEEDPLVEETTLDPLEEVEEDPVVEEIEEEDEGGTTSVAAAPVCQLETTHAPPTHIVTEPPATQACPVSSNFILVRVTN